MACVLVVEDEPTIAMVLQELLREAGHQVITAHNGAEALQALQATPCPDIMLLDLFLPDTTGRDLLQKARNLESFRDRPVVLITGAVPCPEDFPPEGAYQALIAKPFELDEVLQTVARLVPSSPPGA